jgi:hypothetical protein
MIIIDIVDLHVFVEKQLFGSNGKSLQLQPIQALENWTKKVRRRLFLSLSLVSGSLVWVKGRLGGGGDSKGRSDG